MCVWVNANEISALSVPLNTVALGSRCQIPRQLQRYCATRDRAIDHYAIGGANGKAGYVADKPANNGDHLLILVARIVRIDVVDGRATGIRPGIPHLSI